MASKKNPKKKRSTGSSRPNKVTSWLAERKLQNYEEYPMQMNDDDDDDDGVEMMLKAVAEQVRAEQAEKVGNHFAAEAVKKEWTCSACTYINQATEDACAMCDKKNTKEKDDHDVWLAKRESWREAMLAVKKP